MKYEVIYQDHDQQAKGGRMVRETKERAEQTARILRECGYKEVTIKLFSNAK